MGPLCIFSDLNGIPHTCTPMHNISLVNDYIWDTLKLGKYTMYTWSIFSDLKGIPLLIPIA